jgi:hypothetical protein
VSFSRAAQGIIDKLGRLVSSIGFSQPISGCIIGIFSFVVQSIVNQDRATRFIVLILGAIPPFVNRGFDATDFIVFSFVSGVVRKVQRCVIGIDCLD